MLDNNHNGSASRRSILQAGAAYLTFGFAPAILAKSARAASPKTLRILRWKNFIPAYETWFNDVFVPEWGRQNDTDVVVDNVGMGDIEKFAAAEAKAGQGHDIVLFLSPRPSLEDHVIDHRDIFQECEHRFGKAYPFAVKSCFNARTRRFHGFCASYLPTLVTYRKDIWDAVGKMPDTWDDLRKAGRAVKLLHDAPVGISFGLEHNAEHSQRALMAAFGSSIQNSDGQPSLYSGQTLDVLKFAKALYKETMRPEVLSWTPPSNNQALLAGSASLTIDTMSIIRAAESKQLLVEPNLALALLPEGPAGRSGPAYGTNTFVIWKFAQNMIGAKKFLVDYVAAFRDGLEKSGFQNMPSFPGAVPELDEIISAIPGRTGRYDLLREVPATLTNLGYPGYSNAATDEVLSHHIVSEMFASVVAGKSSAQEAMDLADTAITLIFEKWRQAGKI